MSSQTAIPLVPESAPFSAQQRAWLNGYLAGLTSMASATQPASAAPAAARKPLLILYGSQSGTAEGLAKRMGKEAPAHGWDAKVAEANSCSVEQLSATEHLLLITSTWGDGDAPDNATQLFAALQASNAPALNQLSFAVLALGDKNYSEFCGAGKKFDERLAQLGARRLHPRTDCDLDYEAAASQWMSGAWQALGAGSATSADSAVELAATKSSEPALRAAFSRNSPFPSRLLTNRLLTGNGSAKEVRHFEIALENSGLSYEAGDALGVFPSNCPALVGDILSTLGCDGEEAVKAPDGSEISFRNALLRHYQITQPTTPFLEAVAERAQSAELKTLLAPVNKAALEKHLHGREIIDLLLEHRLARFTPPELVALLRKCNLRLYSIASSPKAHPGEVHLCVGIVRYESLGRTRKGVCSTFLADRCDGEVPLPVFVQTSHGFRLPENSETPIIMVGPGTGIAPFRAFLEERQATGARGRNWLFFGDQKRQTDFLYRDQLECMFKDGALTRLDLAFSRDQAEKVYVQHRMVEHARELFGWLEDGAHFYVCGDAKRMAKDVDAALHDIIRVGGERSAEDAAAYVQNLKTAKRYQRDVY